MSQPIITVENLSKAYRIGLKEEQPDTFAGALIGWIKAPLRNWKRLQNLNTFQEAPPQADDSSIVHRQSSIPPTDILWALNDISFEVSEGEVVGIIGRNGAGKSTLLKILSRITEPTSGRVVIRGRVSSLLEVGTGFHPELTGRENIYMNGTILGMRKKEIDRKLDEIIDFSGIEKFLDTPVKRYSSGMNVRLAFAVAAHLEPEILIIDEVLAVGDADFQKKCLGKMRDAAQGGRTILFVSHNMTAVQNLCNRVIRLDKGSVLDDAPSKQVVSQYLDSVLATATEHVWDDMTNAPGNDLVRVRRAAVVPQGDSENNLITIRTPLDLVFEFWNKKPGAHVNLSLVLRDPQRVAVFNTGPVEELEWNGKAFPSGLFRSSCRIPGDLLNDGMYSVSLYVVHDECHVIYQHDDILVFDVADDGSGRGAWNGEWIGTVRPMLDWRSELIEAD